MLLGLGFGLPCVFAVRHVARTGDVRTFMGFPTYSNGPFEPIGIPTSTPLLLGFRAVCLAEVALGCLIWSGAPGATVISLALLPAEFAFWIGFALPFGPPVGIARTIFVLMP